jgi:PAS domain-containing protein
MAESLEAQLRATLNMIPAYTWYVAPSGALTFVNERSANYPALAKDHPRRSGTRTGTPWNSKSPFSIQMLTTTRGTSGRTVRTPARRVSEFRVRDADGNDRWFLSRAEPLRWSAGTLRGFTVRLSRFRLKKG